MKLRMTYIDDNGVVEYAEFYNPPTEDLAMHDMDYLVRNIVLLQDVRREMTQVSHLFELELRRKMEADGATEFPGGAGTATLKEVGAKYDPHKLDTLLEVLDKDELVADGALVEAHEEVRQVPRTWNATKLRKFTRRGQAIADVIAGARIPGDRVLKVEARE